MLNNSKLKNHKLLLKNKKKINNIVNIYKFKNQNFFFIEKLNFIHKKYNTNQTLYSTKINNTCILTNRSNGILKKFKLSRISFKKLISQKLLTGIKKSSW